jgi:hypothetical protein
MKLINREEVVAEALRAAQVHFKVRNKMRVAVGLSPLRSPPTKVSDAFINAVQGQVIIAIEQMIKDHKEGDTL